MNTVNTSACASHCPEKGWRSAFAFPRGGGETRGGSSPPGTRTGEGADEQEEKRDFRSASARSRAALHLADATQ